MNSFKFQVLEKMVGFVVENVDVNDIDLLKKNLVNHILETVIESDPTPDKGFSLFWKLGVTPDDLSLNQNVDTSSCIMYRKFFNQVFNESLDLECIEHLS